MSEIIQGSEQWLAALRREFSVDFGKGELVRVSSKQRPDRINQPAGYVDNCGYIRVYFQGRKYLRSHLIFCLFHGRLPSGHVDHINRNRTDDRPENLREATHHQNMWNRTPKKRALPMGVSERDGKFEARIMCQRKLYRLGRFVTVEEAAAAYGAARKEMFGEYA